MFSYLDKTLLKKEFYSLNIKSVLLGVFSLLFLLHTDSPQFSISLQQVLVFKNYIISWVFVTILTFLKINLRQFYACLTLYFSFRWPFILSMAEQCFIVCIDTTSSQASHLLVDTGCFCVLTIVNSAVVNIGVCISFQISAFIFSGYMSRSKIAKSHGSSYLQFFKDPPYCFPQWLH